MGSDHSYDAALTRRRALARCRLASGNGWRWIAFCLLTVGLGCAAPSPSSDSADLQPSELERALAAGCPDGSSWQEMGALAQGCAREDGVLHGPVVFYDANRVRSAQVTYVDGEIEGWVVRWWSDGTMRSAGHEHDGQRVGTWRWWGRKGRLASVTEFDPPTARPLYAGGPNGLDGSR